MAQTVQQIDLVQTQKWQRSVKQSTQAVAANGQINIQIGPGTYHKMHSYLEFNVQNSGAIAAMIAQANIFNQRKQFIGSKSECYGIALLQCEIDGQLLYNVVSPQYLQRMYYKKFNKVKEMDVLEKEFFYNDLVNQTAAVNTAIAQINDVAQTTKISFTFDQFFPFLFLGQDTFTVTSLMNINITFGNSILQPGIVASVLNTTDYLTSGNELYAYKAYLLTGVVQAKMFQLQGGIVQDQFRNKVESKVYKQTSNIYLPVALQNSLFQAFVYQNSAEDALSTVSQNNSTISFSPLSVGDATKYIRNFSIDGNQIVQEAQSFSDSQKQIRALDDKTINSINQMSFLLEQHQQNKNIQYNYQLGGTNAGQAADEQVIIYIHNMI